LIGWRLSSLSKSNEFWGLAAVLSIGFALIIMLLGNEAKSNQFLGAASRLQTYVSIASISCLSIEPHKVVFDRKEYWNPKLPEEIVDRLGIKTVLLNADYAACPWSFFATVVPGTVPAVRYNDQAAQYLVSIGICQRNLDGSINPNKCLTKNIYVFNSGLVLYSRPDPIELFSLALDGLASPQTNNWEMFKNKESR
jgi:hypothetical protein